MSPSDIWPVFGTPSFISHPGPIMEQTAAVASLAWSPRGDILAIEGALEEIKDYSIKLWKVENYPSLLT